MHRHAELVYIWIFWVVDCECWLWIWTWPVNLSLIRTFTFSVVLVCELVSMPTTGYVTCGCQRHTFFPRRIAPACLGSNGASALFLSFCSVLPPPPLNPCRNVFGLKTNIVLRCFWGLMKNWVLVSVGWPAQQMGCWSTTDWEAKNTSCMVQRQVKKRHREPSTEEKNIAPDVLLQSCRQPPL